MNSKLKKKVFTANRRTVWLSTSQRSATGRFHPHNEGPHRQSTTVAQHKATDCALGKCTWLNIAQNCTERIDGIPKLLLYVVIAIPLCTKNSHIGSMNLAIARMNLQKKMHLALKKNLNISDNRKNKQREQTRIMQTCIKIYIPIYCLKSEETMASHLC
jgi:hypothetical protein